MARKIIDLSLTVEDNMPAHKLFQSQFSYSTFMIHQSFNLGVEGDL